MEEGKEHLVVDKQKELENRLSEYKWKFYIPLFIIGLFNNLGYVLIGSSAQDLASHFGMDTFMGVFQFALILFCAFTRIINSRYLINIAHKKKILCLIILSGLSYLIIGLSELTSQKWGFFTAVAGTLIMGVCQALGEAVMLGFLKAFPSNFVGMFSSGTGLAGFFGALYVLLLTTIQINPVYLYVGMIVPTIVIYFFSFRYIVGKRHDLLADFEENMTSNDQEIEHSANHMRSFATESVDEQEEDEAKVNNKFDFHNAKIVLKKIYWFSSNLMVVYFLEYVTFTGFADRANPKSESDKSDEYFTKHAFILLQCAYQFGVMVSRSSLSLFKIKRVEILTIFQLINFCLFLKIALDRFLDIYWQFGLMIWVGIMGGCSYVNVMYTMLEKPDLKRSEKELSINLCTFFNDIGVLLASIVVIIAANTFLK